MLSDIIFIKDLTLNMSIGVYDHEKQKPQRVIVNIEMYIASGGYDDENLDSTVCYETVTNQITALATQKHYNLVETFAEDIAALCLQNPRIQSLTIEAEKPDIMPGSTRVGVKISRSRSA